MWRYPGMNNTDRQLCILINPNIRIEFHNNHLYSASVATYWKHRKLRIVFPIWWPSSCGWRHWQQNYCLLLQPSFWDVLVSVLCVNLYEQDCYLWGTLCWRSVCRMFLGDIRNYFVLRLHCFWLLELFVGQILQQMGSRNKRAVNWRNIAIISVRWVANLIMCLIEQCAWIEHLCVWMPSHWIIQLTTDRKITPNNLMLIKLPTPFSSPNQSYRAFRWLFDACLSVQADSICFRVWI